MARAGLTHGVGTPFTKLYALAFAQAARQNLDVAALTIARIAISARPCHDPRQPALIPSFSL